MGNVVDELCPDLSQKGDQNRGTGGAVDIVVPPDTDELLVFDGVNDALNRRLHIGHRKRRRQIRAETRREIALGRVQVRQAAQHKQARQEKRDLQLFRLTGDDSVIGYFEHPAFRHITRHLG